MGSSLSDGISIKNSMGASGAEIVTAWLGILQEYAISCHLRRKTFGPLGLANSCNLTL